MELFLDLLKNTLLGYIVYRLVTRSNTQQTEIRKLKSHINTCIENIETLEQNIIKVRDVLDSTRTMLATQSSNVCNYSL
jgi:hypothetical protein